MTVTALSALSKGCSRQHAGRVSIPSAEPKSRERVDLPEKKILEMKRDTTRRQLLYATVALGTMTAPLSAQASPFDLKLPWAGFLNSKPTPVRVPRKQLDLNFAVLLLRSTYDAVDALDFVPMNKYQMKTWKFRQEQSEPYKALMDPVPVPVGNLQSPLYFDFMAFVQYATISDLIPDAPQVFEEFCEECEGEALEKPYRVVRRNPAFADNEKLPEQVQLEIARTLYTNLRNGFRGRSFECPAPLEPSDSEHALVRGVETLLETFRTNGFAINADVRDVSKGGDGSLSWTIHTEGGANLWGLQALQARHNSISAAFDGLAVLGFLDASGYDSRFSVRANGTFSEQDWNVRRRRRQELV